MTTETIHLRVADLADRVSSNTGRIDLRRVLVGLLVLVPFVLGWLAGTTLRAVLTLSVWFWSATQVGFQAGRAGRSDDQAGGGSP